MDHRPLDITVVSASGLKNVNLFMKMGVYVVVSLISGESVQKQKTHVSKGGGNPMWSHQIKFSVEESVVQSSTLIFILRSRRVLGDRIIGEVSIPVRDLLENDNGGTDQNDEHVVEYQVRSIRGKGRGTLTFSHKMKGEIAKNKNTNGEDIAKNGPPQGNNNAYPTQPYGGGWNPSYAPQQTGYVCNQQQQPAAAATKQDNSYSKSKKKKHGGKKSKFGFGLGAGLIGGLLVSDAVDVDVDSD